MFRRIAIGFVAAVGALTISSPGMALNGEPCYSIMFFSDASQTTMVGFAKGVCLPSGPSSQLVWGVSSPHQVFTEVGVCIDGVLWPS